MTGVQPFPLRAWSAVTRFAGPVVNGLLSHRVRAGKEDPARIGERLGRTATPRPAGTLVWLHGASVGESLVAWTMAMALRAVRPDLAILLTSGTRTSAGLIGARIATLADSRICHQFVPVDVPDAVSRFLGHWRPDLAVFVEGEIWPNLLMQTRAWGCPTTLVNARMTDGSLRGWARLGQTARALFGGFDLIHPADVATAAGLAAITGRACDFTPSNLKLVALPPEVRPEALAALRDQIGSRPVWLAASTHDGEERLVVAAHAMLQVAMPRALLVLAPRHPERTPDVRVTCTLAGMSHQSRDGDGPLRAETDVLIWNTMGELPLACATCPVTVLAGSLVPGIGGHNPVEPLHMGSAVVIGPYGFNFEDLFSTLAGSGGVRRLDQVSGDTIAMAVAALLGDEAVREASVANGRAAIKAGSQALNDLVAKLMGLLPVEPV